MAEEVTKEDIEAEKRRIKERISQEAQQLKDVALKKAKILEQHAKKEPFPDGESLLEKHHSLVKGEKKLDDMLEPRTIKKPDHHLDEAEKTKLKSKKIKK